MLWLPARTSLAFVSTVVVLSQMTSLLLTLEAHAGTTSTISYTTHCNSFVRRQWNSLRSIWLHNDGFDRNENRLRRLEDGEKKVKSNKGKTGDSDTHKDKNDSPNNVDSTSKPVEAPTMKAKKVEEEPAKTNENSKTETSQKLVDKNTQLTKAADQPPTNIKKVSTNSTDSPTGKPVEKESAAKAPESTKAPKKEPAPTDSPTQSTIVTQAPTKSSVETNPPLKATYPPTDAPKATDSPSKEPTKIQTEHPKPAETAVTPTKEPVEVSQPSTAPDPTDPQNETDVAPTSNPAFSTVDPTSKNGSTDDEEGGSSGILWLLLFVCIGGAACYAKKKVSFHTGPGTYSLGGAGRGGGGPFGGSPLSGSGFGRNAKYEQVAVQEEDEEWGWGDEDNDVEDDIELTPNYHMDRNLINRRPSNDANQTSKKSSVQKPKKSPHRPSPSITRPLSNPTTSDSLSDMPTLSVTNQSSMAPPESPSVSGLSLKKGSTLVRPNGATAPSHLFTVSPSLGATATITNTEFTNPSTLSSSFGGAPLKVTSLPKKSHIQVAPEDDIFASMGLSAMPTFSQAPSSAPTRAIAKATSSPWASTTPPLVSSSTAFRSLIADNTSSRIEVGATSMASPSLNATSSGADEDWDDDADLDDLLDN